MSGPAYLGRIAVWLLAANLLAPLPAAADVGDYRVEVLVFRHVYTDAAPLEVDSLRGMHGLFEPGPDEPPEVPVAVGEASSTFSNLWNRLQRLDAYEPLTMQAWMQTRIDYHPPVRVHDAEVIAEEIHFPGQVVAFDLTGNDLFAPYRRPLYRLDGSVQLRRSRFLHLHLDLEYRLDVPPALTPPDPPLAELTLLGPIARASGEEAAAPGVSDPVMDESGTEAEGARVHRLNQSRQVRTDTMLYFDTAYLGVLARVTAVAPERE